MAEGADLSFIHLGISVQNMTKSFSIFGVSFAYYGLIIGIGMIAGLLVAQQDAKRRGQDPEIYLDFMLYGVIFAFIGARLYYVVFQWGYYKDHLAEIFNIRKGGLAIYGGRDHRRSGHADRVHKKAWCHSRPWRIAPVSAL